MATVDRFDFNKESIDQIRKLRHYNNNVGYDWPVVYLLNDDKEI